MTSLLAKTSHFRVRDVKAFAHVDRSLESRIVGGEAAVEGQFPYIISLRYRGFGHFCGASIITARYGATAAHCLEDMVPEDLGWVSSKKNGNYLKTTQRTSVAPLVLRCHRLPAQE